jgi:hypothetical protein
MQAGKMPDRASGGKSKVFIGSSVSHCQKQNGVLRFE